MTRLSKLLLAICAFIAALHMWAAIYPSHENWGVHFFAFYDPWISLPALLVLAFLALPKYQTIILNAAERALRIFSKFPLVVHYLLLAALIVSAALMFSAKLHLLGDGALLLRSTWQAAFGTDISASFQNQPLTKFVYLWVMNFFSVPASADAHTIYFAIDLIAALLFLLVILWCARGLRRPSLENLLFGCFLFCGAGSQFFFGYVENYVLLYVATAAYAVTGWFALEKRIHVAVPIILYFLMVGLHVGSLIFLPGILILVLWQARGKVRLAVISLSGIALLAVSFFYFAHVDVLRTIRHVTTEGVDILRPFTAVGGNFPYPMFSLPHVVDWLNANFLVVPLGFLPAVILLAAYAKELRWKHPAFVFLAVTAACGLLFTWIVNTALGMARDWDLLSSFFVPLMVLVVYLLSQIATFTPRRYILVIIVAISFLHWAAWIGVNSDADRHLARMEMLNSPRLLSLNAQMYHSEALASFFYENKQYRNAKIYYERFNLIDSTSPRIIANMADLYKILGEKDNYFRALRRTAQLNSSDAGVYADLGVEYSSRGDTATAISQNEKAVQLNPNQKQAHANLGILYLKRGNYALSVNHLTAAIELGLNDPPLYRAAGGAYIKLKEYGLALKYYNAYLGLVPADTVTRNLRDKLRNLINTQNKH